MKKIRGEEVRTFILENIPEAPGTIAKLTADTFGITRQAVNKHLKVLLAANLILQEGQTRNCIYKLNSTLNKFLKEYVISENLAEDVVWQQDALPLLRELPKNVLNICHYGFTEMFNNAIDHSEGSHIYVEIYESKKIGNCSRPPFFF